MCLCLLDEKSCTFHFPHISAAAAVAGANRICAKRGFPSLAPGDGGGDGGGYAINLLHPQQPLPPDATQSTITKTTGPQIFQVTPTPPHALFRLGMEHS